MLLCCNKGKGQPCGLWTDAPSPQLFPNLPMTLCKPKPSVYLSCLLLIPILPRPLLPAWDIVILNKCLTFLEWWWGSIIKLRIINMGDMVNKCERG